MRIRIQTAGKRPRTILLPNWLIMNPITAFFVGHDSAKQKEEADEPSFTPKQLRKLFREIKRLKRKYRKQGWYLVEAQEADGSQLKIQF